MEAKGTYDFLLEAYRTEILKTSAIWEAFPASTLNWRPHAKSRTVLEQFDHQVKSEARWMREMMGIDTGEPDPLQTSPQAYIEKYRSDAQRRLEALREKPDEWWREEVTFFDVRRPRAWIMVRRLNHSAHHRGQLVVYLRMLEIRVPSVYGPTADTNGKVRYKVA